jgi:hypothetical protein
MIRIEFSNGTNRTFRDTDTLSVRSGISGVSKPGYERTREYPMEWSKFVAIRVTALAQGAEVHFGSELVKIESIAKAEE